MGQYGTVDEVEVSGSAEVWRSLSLSLSISPPPLENKNYLVVLLLSTGIT
eukprot:SAG31_NODE_1779_length_7293_cov_39.850153_9_plen_49_part_01